MSEVSDRMRREWKRNDAIRDAGLTTPPDVARLDDIPYGPEARWQLLDLYRPAAPRETPWPVIVSVHGGGWVYGDKELYQYYCMGLARRGFAVVNFTYRLAPEFKYPAAMEDTNAVFHWVLEHAARYGLDAGRVFAVGDSAGAHMLALYACMCTNPEYAARYAFAPPAGFAPRAIALNCGVYDLENRDGELMNDLLDGGPTPENVALISPLRYITPAFPTTFAMAAVGDDLRVQTPLLVRALEANDVPFVYRLYGSRDNRLGHVFHCDMRSPDAALCNDEECDFFRRLA